MDIEQKINYQLNKYPPVKKVIKRLYQLTMYAMSKKSESRRKYCQIITFYGYEYFFGYYDKSPWDATDRYVLCLRAKDTWSDVSPREMAEIILIDTMKPESDKERIRKIAVTHAWNVQQGCMMQWLGPDYKSRIIYNDCRDGKYCSVIMEIATMRERIIKAPVYTVSTDGKFALTLDYRWF